MNPDGTHDFTYDSRGLMATQAVSSEGTYTYGYDVMGRNSLLTYPDGHTRTQLYDDLGRITSRCYGYPGPTTRCYSAQYDAVGNPTRMVDPDGADVFVYDALDRVKKVTREINGVPGAVEDYAYNALGALKLNAGVTLDDQRPRLAGGGNTDAAVPASVGGQPIVLDPAGRITQLRGATLVWSGEGALREVDAPIPALAETFGIDAQGRRFDHALGGTIDEYYIYEGLDRIATLDGSRALKESYLFDGIDHPLRINIPNAGNPNYYYYELDLAGNVRGLRASGGASLGGYRYSAFGKTLEDTTSVTQALRWKGRWFSPVAGGTYDVRARQWSPELGIFLSVDEFAMHDRESTLWGWPRQNPVRWRDPSGRGPDTLCSLFGWLLGGLCDPDPPPEPAAPPPEPGAGCGYSPPKKPRLPEHPHTAEAECWLKQMDIYTEGYNVIETSCTYHCDQGNYDFQTVSRGANQCPKKAYDAPF